MKYEPEKHHRHSLRLKNFDYAQTGAYFVTVVTQHRICLFSDIINSEAQLSAAGTMLQAVWSELPIHYSGIKTDVFVVMPNHFHGIIFLVGATPRGCPSPGQAQGLVPTAMSLPDVLHRFKTLATKRYTDGVKQSGWSPFAGRLWQRNYYEHVIRDEESLNRIRQYIADNPMHWEFDPENPDTKTLNKGKEGDRSLDSARDTELVEVPVTLRRM